VVLDAVGALGEDDVQVVQVRVQGDEYGGARVTVGVGGVRPVGGEAGADFTDHDYIIVYGAKNSAGHDDRR
jgi:hypothetical protein